MAHQLSRIVLIMLICLIRLPIRNDEVYQSKPYSLVIFSDYQSTSCREALPWLLRLRVQSSDELRILIKHFPLPDHPQSFLAARAAFCASCLGRFWEYHERLFTASDLAEPLLIRYAVEIDLDEFEFEQCLESDASRDSVAEDRDEAMKLKLSSLPAFVLDGRVLIGVRSLPELLREVQAERNRKS